MVGNDKLKLVVSIGLMNLLIISSMLLISTYSRTELTDTLFCRNDEMYSPLFTTDSSVSVTQTNSIFQPTNSISTFADTLDWGVDDIDAEKVWGIFNHAADIHSSHIATGAGIKIAILDSGIYYDGSNVHSEFTGKIVDEYDFYYLDNNAEDNGGHGTHCAGITSAKDNNLGIIGVAPESSLLIGKIFEWVFDPYYGEYKYEICDEIDLVNAIDWAVDNGVNIISMSWGGASSPLVFIMHLSMLTIVVSYLLPLQAIMMVV